MQVVNGKDLRAFDAALLAAWTARYRDVTLDLGTGDGRFVRHLARHCPTAAAIGLDTCPANLRNSSRSAPDNALFLIADALTLPAELERLATCLTVNFPWGSLLRGLVDGDRGLLDGLRRLGRTGASLEVTVNAGALTDLGWTLEAGGEHVASVLGRAGFPLGPISLIGPEQLLRYPTTWAKRLAFGRDPRAMRIGATLA
jgi:16S rRNA (adenine(1408)-N(1))-methyltransferase